MADFWADFDLYVWRAICLRCSVPLPLIFGRTLAIICHPLLAWKRLPTSGRFALAGGYAALSYLASLTALVALRA